MAGDTNETVNLQRLYLPAGALAAVVLGIWGWMIALLIAHSSAIAVLEQKHLKGYHDEAPALARQIAREEVNTNIGPITSRLVRIESKLDRLYENAFKKE